MNSICQSNTVLQILFLVTGRVAFNKFKCYQINHLLWILDMAHFKYLLTGPNNVVFEKHLISVFYQVFIVYFPQKYY